MDAVNDLLRHWLLCPSYPEYAASRGKAVEMVSALSITSTAQCNGTGPSRHHGVVMLFMSLLICAKLNAAVLIVVGKKACYYRPGAHCH